MPGKVILDKESQQVTIGAFVNLSEDGVTMYEKLAASVKNLETNTPSYNKVMESLKNTEKSFNNMIAVFQNATNHTKDLVEITEKMEKASYIQTVESKNIDFTSHAATTGLNLV